MIYSKNIVTICIYFLLTISYFIFPHFLFQMIELNPFSVEQGLEEELIPSFMKEELSWPKTSMATNSLQFSNLKIQYRGQLYPMYFPLDDLRDLRVKNQKRRQNAYLRYLLSNLSKQIKTNPDVLVLSHPWSRSKHPLFYNFSSQN